MSTDDDARPKISQSLIPLSQELRLLRIKLLNDQFRRTSKGGLVLLTTGVSELSAELRHQFLREITLFTDFSEDNDPHNEHDFGKVVISGEIVLWKIDYYGLDMIHGSPDPSTADVTQRVLTIMLAREY